MTWLFSSLMLAGLVAAKYSEPKIYVTPTLSPGDPDYVTPAEINAGLAQIEKRDIDKRSPPAGVYICDAPNWTGNCAWFKVADGACNDFIWDASASFGVSTQQIFFLIPQHAC